VTPSIDSIEEVKVLTSNYGAKYPSSGSGTTRITTKSGTDKYHGSAYEFLRNEMFNAKGYFDVTNGAPLYRRQDLGGTFGGPLSIPHLYDGTEKTHFFFSEDVRWPSAMATSAIFAHTSRQGDILPCQASTPIVPITTATPISVTSCPA
jgi:hypothetical protein